MIGRGKVDILYIVYPQFIFIKTFLNVNAVSRTFVAAYEFTILELLPLVITRPDFSLESHLPSLPTRSAVARASTISKHNEAKAVEAIHAEGAELTSVWICLFV